MNTVTIDGTAYFGKDKTPKINTTAGGLSVLNFTVGFWQGKDQDKGYVEVTCWEQLAENVNESIRHGDRVVVTGRLQHRKWVTAEGANLSKLSVTADEVGLSLRFDAAESKRPNDAGTSGYGGGAGRQASVGDLESPF